MIPRTMMRYDFWFYIIVYAAFEVLENYNDEWLPDLKDRFALMSYPMGLLTFTSVFFLNNTWTRYLKLYDAWQSMHIEAVELTMLVVTKCKDFDRARRIVNYAVGSLYLNLYAHQEESGDEKLKETGLIPQKHFEKLQAAIDDGYCGSDMLDMWSLRELQDSNIKGPELNFVQARQVHVAKIGFAHSDSVVHQSPFNVQTRPYNESPDGPSCASRILPSTECHDFLRLRPPGVCLCK